MNKGQEFKIFVKNSKDKRIGISVNENDSIATLKQKIKLALGIGDDKNIKISYNGEILLDEEDEDEETSSPYKISDYEIKDGDSIDALVPIFTKQKLDFENNADNDKIDEDDTNKDDKSNLHQNLNISSSRLKNHDLNLTNKNFRCKTYTNEDKNEKLNVKIIIDEQTNKFVEVTIDKNAKLRDLLSEASKSENMKDISYFKLAILDGNLLGSESLDKTINELGFTDKSCECWISLYTLDNNKKDEDKLEDWLDLKSISLSQNGNSEDIEKNEDDSITLIISNYGKEVTRLNVTKNTTMKEIKEQLQQKYNLSDKRINELNLCYNNSDIFCNLNDTVEQIFNENEIKKREVKAYTQGFDFNLKTSEKEIEIDNKSEGDNKNDRNKDDMIVNTRVGYGTAPNLDNNNNNDGFNNQIIEEKEDSEKIINTKNETKTNNEEDNENKDDKLNSKQNLNASELNGSENNEINYQIDNDSQKNIPIENYIPEKSDSNFSSNENSNNDDSDYESSQNLDQKLKESKIKTQTNNEEDNEHKNDELDPEQNLNVSELNKNENNEKNLDLINNEICPKINDVQEDIPNKLETISANETEKKTTDMNGTISSSVNNEQRKIDNQIIEENQDEKEDSEKIINTKNETKTNNEEDNENKDDKLNSKQNLNASELNGSENNEINYQIDNDSQKKISGEMKKIEEKQFTIAVKDSKNQSIYVSVDKDELITNLKSKIKKQLGIKDNENIELIHNVNILGDNGKISDYEIENNSVIIWTWSVLAKAINRDIKMNDKENDNRKKDKKINWKLILLGLLFFVCAGLAWYLGAAWFLIGGLVVVGIVFFGLSFMRPKLKSCIGCIKIGVSTRTEKEDINSLSKSKSQSPVVINDELPLEKQKI